MLLWAVDSSPAATSTLAQDHAHFVPGEPLGSTTAKYTGAHHLSQTARLLSSNAVSLWTCWNWSRTRLLNIYGGTLKPHMQGIPNRAAMALSLDYPIRSRLLLGLHSLWIWIVWNYDSTPVGHRRDRRNRFDQDCILWTTWNLWTIISDKRSTS